MKVCKFGGTSVANAEQIRKVAAIVMADIERKIVVVSAPGKRWKEDTKVTDLLIAYAETCVRAGEAATQRQAVIERYSEMIDELGLPQALLEEISADLQGIIEQGTDNQEKFMAYMKAFGENSSAKVVAAYLCSLGVDASYVNPREAGLLVQGDYGNAQVIPEAYERLHTLREHDGIVVFPGFFGYTLEGELLTFSRGGSDVTGSILAAAVKANLYENFTDVDSVYSINPSLVSNPYEISELTYREMRELSYAGFGVFHEEALIPAFRANVPVNIKNTNNPSAPGTMVVAERNATTPVVGVSSDSGFCSIFINKYLMNKVIGFGRALYQILEDEGLAHEHAPSGIDDINVIMRSTHMTLEKEERMIKRIREELAADDVKVLHNLALVVVVGEGMRRSVGTTARASNALAKAGVNIEMLTQGSSEVSIIFAVRDVDVQKAVIALYEEFFQSANAFV